MNAAMIPFYIESRMKEMGHCNGYAMRIKHFVIGPEKTVKVSAFGEVFILLEPVPDVRVESDLGVYSNTVSAPEQQHEHTGQIFLTNLTNDGDCNVQFVQAIPLSQNPEACPPCQTHTPAS